jgi:hypothetical protein
MKKLVLICFFSSLFGTSFAQEQTPKSAIISFFEAFHKQDTLGLKQMCHEELILKTIKNTKEGTQLVTENFDDFLVSIGSIPSTMQFEEKILDYKIEQDGNLAHVWTPYTFYINGKFSHQGVNAFTLYYENGKWLIIHLIDTRRK